MQSIGLTAPKVRYLPRNGKGQDRAGRDWPVQDREVPGFKSVKLPTQMQIRNSEVRELLSVSRHFQDRFVVQTWSWMASLRINVKYRDYGPTSAIFTPKGDKTGLGKKGLVKTGAYMVLSQ